MNRYLIFRLSAPLGSMGDGQGNSRRSTTRWPARSAVSGIIGAALGIRRDQSELQSSIDSEYACAVCKVELGPLLLDYHTVQVIPTSVVKRPNSRPNAINEARKKSRKQNTLLTEREYHQDCVFDIALETTVAAPEWPLEKIADALKKPKYLMYFGRKSCPLNQPVWPKIYEAQCVDYAFHEYRRERLIAAEIPDRKTDLTLSFRAQASMKTSEKPIQKVRRRDRIVDRNNWLFTEGDWLEYVISSRTET